MRTATSVCLPRRRLLKTMVASLAVAAPGLAPRDAAAQQRVKPLLAARFRVDAPEKDWRLVPAGINTPGGIVHKDGRAAVIIEHELLQIDLRAEEIDGNFAELELATIKERERDGSGFASRVAQVGRRRAVVVDYKRRSPAGEEQVRVFEVTEGRHLYRLVAVAPSAQFAKYSATFDVVCQSFTPLDA